jgi:antitoxin PrlF
VFLTEVPVITSKLTSKAQTTIPQPVRAALDVAEGDELAYTIEDGRVVLTKAPPRRGHPLDDPFATFTEWDSEADRQAFKDL